MSLLNIRCDLPPLQLGYSYLAYNRLNWSVLINFTFSCQLSVGTERFFKRIVTCFHVYAPLQCKSKKSLRKIAPKDKTLFLTEVLKKQCFNVNDYIKPFLSKYF